jgi:hypothetical protein
MKSKRKILPLAISALLMTGVVNYPMPGYADNDDHNSNGSEHSSGSDSDKRSDSGSGDKSKQKITICHVPPGNPEQMHTIHIAMSAWAAHKAHTNTNDKGLPLADYLGSCNNPPNNTPPATTKEKLHVISGCTGTYRDALATKVQSYFEPITVADTALDDESVVTAMSQCLDKGDSSDSSKSKTDSSKKGDSGKSASGGKGGGRDSVSDSGNHHRIRGCQNKDTEHKADSSDSSKHGLSDSDKDDNNKNYHQKLKSADSGHDTAKGIKDPIVVSDSSLDDDGVWKEFKECAKDAGDPKKIDSSKIGKQKGDSGHKQHILKSCVDDSGDALRTAIVKYKAKASTKDIILTETSYNDVSIKQAVEDCVDASKGKGKDTVTTSLTITGATITHATITNAVITDGKITDGKISAGISSDGNVIGGTITTGTVTGGTTTGTTITGATITGATVTGVSGRLNVREDTSPK